jgi:TP901 family phage tail tape measure protein
VAKGREVKVAILGDAASFDKAFTAAADKADSFGDRMTKVGNLIATATVAGVAGAAVGLFKLGAAFDDAYDKIRIGTGATGASLKGLEEDFKAVVQNVPTDFGSASTAVADLNARLGISGLELRSLSIRFLELSRLTNTDLSANIANLTRLFGDWGVASGDQAHALDEVFRASQATGAGIDALSTQAVQFGAPLRQMGFSLSETLTLLGKFEKEGVNTELVMGSLRIALGKMARDGKPVVETFRRTVDAIKDAGDASSANALALELFGARAGPDMAAAIREGRFAIGALFDQVAGGSETILQAASDTRDFSEQWQMFKNRVLVALEPLATKVFTAIGDGMTKISDWVTAHQAEINQFFTDLQEKLRQAWQVAGPILEDIVSGLIKIAEWMAKLPAPVQIAMGAIAAFGVALAVVSAHPVVAAITAILVAGGLLVENWGSVSKFFSDKWTDMVTGARNAVNDIIGIINELIGAYNKIPFLPDIGLIGELGGGGSGAASGPAGSVPWLPQDPGFNGPTPAVMGPFLTDAGYKKLYGLSPGQTNLFSGAFDPNMPGLPHGGIVAKTGLAVVHEGEEWSGVGSHYQPLGTRSGGGSAGGGEYVPIVLQLDGKTVLELMATLQRQGHPVPWAS